MAEERRNEAAERAGWCADLLGLGRPLDLWASGLALVALAALLFERGSAPLLWASLAVALIAKYFALRVRLDEAVFRRWAALWAGADGELPAATMAAFDRALGRPAAGRPLESRCRGAQRLLHWQAVFTVLQTACALAAAMYIR